MHVPERGEPIPSASSDNSLSASFVPDPVSGLDPRSPNTTFYPTFTSMMLSSLLLLRPTDVLAVSLEALVSHLSLSYSSSFISCCHCHTRIRLTFMRSLSVRMCASVYSIEFGRGSFYQFSSRTLTC